jgi:hypothetical protein
MAVSKGAGFRACCPTELRASPPLRGGKAATSIKLSRSLLNGKAARGGSIDATGVAVAGGIVFVSSGYPQWGGMPGNVLLAFSVDGK